MKRHTPIVLAVVILGVAAFWYLRPAAEAEPQKIVELAKPGAVLTPAPATPQVAAPVVAPTPKPAETPAPVVVDAKADPHLELGSTLSDMASRLQSGDLFNTFMEYGSPRMLATLTPENRANMQQSIQEALSDPSSQQQMQLMVQGLLTMKTMTPTLDATGNTATYELPTPAGAAAPGTTAPATINVRFTKVDDKWYIATIPVTINQVNGSWKLMSRIGTKPNSAPSP